MTIKTDALSILKFVVERPNRNSSEIETYFEFDRMRTREALEYLEQKGLVSIKIKTFGAWINVKPTAGGIDYTEKILLEEKTPKVETKLINFQRKESSIEQKKEIKESKKYENEEISDSLSRIERSVKSLRSRQYRETTYNASLYPVIIASFFAIIFTSAIEFTKILIPKEYYQILMGVYYFTILISIGMCSLILDKMRKNLDVDNYIALFEIQGKINKIDLLTKSRKIYEDNEHQIHGRPFIKFEGILVNNITF